MMASLCMDVCLLSIGVTATLNIFGMIGCQSLRMRQLDHNKYVDEIAKSQKLVEAVCIDVRSLPALNRSVE